MSDNGSEAEAASRRRRWASFAALAAAIVVVDQLTKTVVDQGFAPAWTSTPSPGLAAPTPILGEFIRIAKTFNRGGIFGLFGDTAPVLAVASLLVITVIVVYQRREGTTGPWLLTISLGLLLGGAIGNLIDRIRFGHVIDFVDMGIGEVRWYTFNVADAAISGAILGLIVITLLGDRPGLRRRSPRRTTAVEPSDAPGHAGT